MNHVTQPFVDDAFWDAFRYVSGEMSESEASDFEGRLADDVSLCECVAEATRLSTLIYRPAVSTTLRTSGDLISVAGSDSASASLSVGGRRTLSAAARATAVVSVCCCLAIVVLAVFSAREMGDGGVASNPSSGADAEFLVDLWSSGDAGSGGPVTEESAETDMFGPLEVPEWMMVAVSQEYSGAESENAADPEDLLFEDESI
ncbi:MAG: hypothetical protein KDA89_09500 [Planctomycetaceae bacterium]|nr:hypothetical protein [Planctomycetaceae bacterium]